MAIVAFSKQNSMFKNLNFLNKIEHCVFGLEGQFCQGIWRVCIPDRRLLVMGLGQLASNHMTKILALTSSGAHVGADAAGADDAKENLAIRKFEYRLAFNG